MNNLQNTIKFTKMQGLGNDFIIVDADEITGMNCSELAKKMCNRNFGVGADGLIIANPSDMKADTDAQWRIFNSDGSEPEMCGNGIRCLARYLYDKKLVDKKIFTINTLAGVITPEIKENSLVRVNMGKPILTPKEIPFDGEMILNHPVMVKDKDFKINAISMGNPHCIIFTEEDSAKLAREYGPLLETHCLFPEKTNVEFVNILARDHIKIDVWERGCGITLACGTGTCATIVAAILNNLTDKKVKADLPGGPLLIEWQGDETGYVFMTGPANYVFSGEYLF